MKYLTLSVFRSRMALTSPTLWCSRVYPPAGRVRITAPLRMNLDIICIFAISKLRWIKQQQQKLGRRNAKRRASISIVKATTSGENATCSRGR